MATEENKEKNTSSESDNFDESEIIIEDYTFDIEEKSTDEAISEDQDAETSDEIILDDDFDDEESLDFINDLIENLEDNDSLNEDEQEEESEETLDFSDYLIEDSDDDKFDYISRIAAEVLGLSSGALAGILASGSANTAIIAVTSAAAGSVLMNALLAALWKDKPGLLESVKNLAAMRKKQKEYERQMSAHLEAAQSASNNLIFELDFDNLIELQEFMIFLPELANYTQEAQITVVDSNGQVHENFLLKDFNIDNPPRSIKTAIDRILTNELNKAETQRSQEIKADTKAHPSSQSKLFGKKLSTSKPEVTQENSPKVNQIGNEENQKRSRRLS